MMEKISRIRELQGKQRTQDEEAEYLKLNSDVTGYPERMFTEEFGQKLSDAITKADSIIESQAMSHSSLTDTFFAEMEVGQSVLVKATAESSYSKNYRWRRKTETRKRFRIVPYQPNANMSTITRIE